MVWGIQRLETEKIDVPIDYKKDLTGFLFIFMYSP